MLGWWPHHAERARGSLVRLLLVLTGLVLVVFSLLVSLEMVIHVLSSRTLNSSIGLPLPVWLDKLSERPEIAYPTHAVLGTALETLNLSPAATAVQWFKAAAHAASEQDIALAARGIADARARGQDDQMIPLMCTLREIGNPRQMQAAQQSGLPCEGWTPPVALTATVSEATASPGARVQIVTQVSSITDVSGLVDVEVHDAEGTRMAQWVFPQQVLAAHEPRTYVVTWEIPPELPDGQYVVKAGLFEADWRALHAWKNAAATVTVAE